MDSQDSSIEEKLVPFVEGALAEADRREVLQALPNQPALNQEVRHLRETIMALRNQAARGLSYQSPVEAPAEQVVDFALQGDQWSRQSSRQFQLHLLESASLNEELAILRELEQDLQQRVEPSKAVPEMPAALRQAIQETYGKPPADPAWKRAAAAIVAWTSGLNLKVASAAVAGCVLVVGAVTVARLNHQNMETSSTTVAVATTAPVAGSATPALAAAEPTPEAAPAGQVALLKEKVLPEDLPGLSRRLYYKGVTHSYQNGQIYVAQADFDKAWSALQMNIEKATGTKALKTGAVAVADKPATNLLDGVIGQLPAADRKEVKVKQPVAAASGGHGPDTDLARPGNMVGASPAPMKAVAIAQPAAPEASQGSYAPAPPAAYSPPTHYDQERRRAADQPVVPRQTVPSERQPEPARAHDPVVPASRPAAGAYQTTAAPSQAAHTGPASTTAGKDADAAPAKIHQVFQSKRKEVGVAQNRPAEPSAYSAPEPAEAPAPPVEALQKPAAAPRPTNTYVPPSKPKAQVAAAQAPAPIAAASNANQEPITEEDTPPPPGQVAFEQKKGDSFREKAENEENRTRSDDSLARANNKQAGYSDNAGAGRVSMGAQANNRSGVLRDESFQVQAGAPFEVAMLPVAKKLVEDLVGEAKVQMERKEDGHLRVTIRPARSLSAEEVDKLRKVVREKLELKEEDTVVIRQP